MDRFVSRKSPRLAKYDYSQEGAYFLTICTQNRSPLFGEVRDDMLQLNSAGEMVAYWWTQIPIKYPTCQIDAFVVMPNHIHGILTIELSKLTDEQSCSVSTVMQWFKTITTNAYIRGVRESGWTGFDRALWQRSFHDHIIRNDAALDNLREYVTNNPARWVQDTFYPVSD